jgi:hypothetical protein
MLLRSTGSRLYSTSRAVAAVVPIIDVEPLIKGNAADKKRVAKEIGSACEKIGEP